MSVLTLCNKMGRFSQYATDFLINPLFFYGMNSHASNNGQKYRPVNICQAATAHFR